MYKNKIKVCIDARPLNGKIDGIARYTFENLRCMVNDDRFHFILLSNRSIVLNLTSKNITLMEDVQYSKLPGTIWLSLRANILAKKYNCDIFWGTQHILPYFKSNSIKYVVTIHDLVNKVLPSTMSNYNQFTSSLFFNKSVINADSIISVSNTTKNDLEKFYPISRTKKSVVIYEGKSLFFKQRSTKLIKEDYIFLLGSLEPRKNIVSVIEIFNGLKKNFSSLKLVISGKIGWKNSTLFNTITNSDYQNDIVITGYISDDEVVDYLQNAKLFIFPSLYEGFGLPLIEAEGMCPVIANDIEIFQELSNGFENLQLININNNKLSLAISYINDFLKNEHKSLSFKPEMKEVFTWQKSALETINIFYSLREKDV